MDENIPGGHTQHKRYYACNYGNTYHPRNTPSLYTNTVIDITLREYC